jgi:hypothetical protein
MALALLYSLLLGCVSQLTGSLLPDDTRCCSPARLEEACSDSFQVFPVVAGMNACMITYSSGAYIMKHSLLCFTCKPFLGSSQACLMNLGNVELQRPMK